MISNRAFVAIFCGSLAFSLTTHAQTRLDADCDAIPVSSSPQSPCYQKYLEVEAIEEELRAVGESLRSINPGHPGPAPSSSEKEGLTKRRKDLQKQLSQKTADLRKCEPPRPRVYSAEVTSVFTGSGTITLPAGSPLGAERFTLEGIGGMNFRLRFSTNRCVVTFVSFPEMRFRTATNDAKIRFANASGNGKYHPSSGRLELSLAADREDAPSLGSGATEPGFHLDLSTERGDARVNAAGHVLLTGAREAQAGLLSGQRVSLEMDGVLAPHP